MSYRRPEDFFSKPCRARNSSWAEKRANLSVGWEVIMVHFYKVYKGFAKTCVNFAIQYLKLKPEVSRQKKTVLNHDLLFRSFNHTDDHRTSYAWSHGADGISYVGSGILYFAIPYMLKAQTCVCIGSGGGYVPRFMYQAQREANVQNARTILIDADKGDCGRPNYLRADSAFRKQFPEIEFVNVDLLIM